MKHIITFMIMALAGCSSSISAGQELVSPYHLVADTAGGAHLDANAQGVAVCATAEVSLAVQRVTESGVVNLGGFVYSPGGASAYAWGYNADGWYVEQLPTAAGAQRYPHPFTLCSTAEIAPAAALVAPAPATGRIVWHE